MAVAKDVADNAASVLTELSDPEKETPAQGVVVKKRLEKEKADRIRDEVERYCEKFEKECLRLFDRSYRKGDPRMMAVSGAFGLYSCSALRKDSPGLQRWCILRADIRQSA
jgi:hypothetical protein